MFKVYNRSPVARQPDASQLRLLASVDHPIKIPLVTVAKLRPSTNLINGALFFTEILSTFPFRHTLSTSLTVLADMMNDHIALALCIELRFGAPAERDKIALRGTRENARDSTPPLAPLREVATGTAPRRTGPAPHVLKLRPEGQIFPIQPLPAI
jgi:hypothetical protein